MAGDAERDDRTPLGRDRHRRHGLGVDVRRDESVTIGTEQNRVRLGEGG